MKKMKKLIVMIAFVVGATTFAQEKRAMDTNKKVEKLTQELDLSQEQQEKVKVLFEKKNNEKQATKVARTPEKAEKMAVRKSENTAFDREMRAILTPEQARKWEAKKGERKRKMSDKARDRKESK